MTDVIEIDEKLLCGGRKYNKGRVKRQLWLFGMISRRTQKLIFIPVFSRCRPLLEAVIRYFIAPGMKICSDGWKAYAHLDKLGYIHQTVIHSRDFLNPNDR